MGANPDNPRGKPVSSEMLKGLIDRLTFAVGELETVKATLEKRRKTITVDGTVMIDERVDRVVDYATRCSAAAAKAFGRAHG